MGPALEHVETIPHIPLQSVERDNIGSGPCSGTTRHPPCRVLEYKWQGVRRGFERTSVIEAGLLQRLKSDQFVEEDGVIRRYQTKPGFHGVRLYQVGERYFVVAPARTTGTPAFPRFLGVEVVRLLSHALQTADGGTLRPGRRRRLSGLFGSPTDRAFSVLLQTPGSVRALCPAAGGWSLSPVSDAHPSLATDSHHGTCHGRQSVSSDVPPPNQTGSTKSTGATHHPPRPAGCLAILCRGFESRISCSARVVERPWEVRHTGGTCVVSRSFEVD